MFCKSCGKEILKDSKFCTGCGATQSAQPIAAKKKGIFTFKWLAIVLGVFLLIAISTAMYLYNNPKIESIAEIDTDARDLDIASAVVNIYCTGDVEEDASGGSGTILTEDGLVMTNAHIIPVGAEDIISCLVVLPDPTDGSPDEIYTAYPILAPGLSEEYDLAFVQIDDVYYDHEEGVAYGEYPKKFPAYDSGKYCKTEDVKLGEPVRIYGYPAISGGYALTITDGIVSSLLVDEGLIVTSAKISHGNSGGLAVDQHGCQIGIPSMVYGDENESLGIIISNNLIYDFIDEVSKLEE